MRPVLILPREKLAPQDIASVCDIASCAGKSKSTRGDVPAARASPRFITHLVNNAFNRIDNAGSANQAAAAAPKDAAAVILLRHQTDPEKPEVFLIKRSTRLAFLGGFYAFP